MGPSAWLTPRCCMVQLSVLARIFQLRQQHLLDYREAWLRKIYPYALPGGFAQDAQHPVSLGGAQTSSRPQMFLLESRKDDPEVHGGLTENIGPSGTGR